VRLEVAASEIGLEGKTLRGMSFVQQGPQVYWGRAGALHREHAAPDPFAVIASSPLTKTENGRWSGRFQLTNTGHYRVVMRNALGSANKPMKEVPFVALSDEPPQVAVERPAHDIVVSQAIKAPLVVTVYDDFALSEVTLDIRGPQGGQPQRRLKLYDAPPRTDTIVATIDLASMSLQVGEEVAGFVTAKDRAGGSGRSSEFKIRIANDDNAADRQLAEFGKTQDAFEENLVKLIAGTSGLQREFDKLSVTYAPILQDQELLDAATAPENPTANLPPETLERIEAFRRDMSKLVALASANAQMANDLGIQMDDSIGRMDSLELLPTPVLGAMETIRLAYRNSVLVPIDDIARIIGEAKEAKPSGMPDLNSLRELSRALQQELDSLQFQFRSLSDSRVKQWGNLDETLTVLQDNMLDHQLNTTQVEMKQLLDYMEQMGKEFQALKLSQQELIETARAGAQEDLDELLERQRLLETKAKPKLKDAQELLDVEELLKQLRRGREPQFPQAPYTPGTDDYYVPPEEEDPLETHKATPGNEENVNDESTRDAKKEIDGEDEELPLYLPVLGGPPTRIDPRFDRLRRPVATRPLDATPRNHLRTRQQRLLDRIQMAGQSVSSDHDTLRTMIDQLGQLMDRNKQRPSSADLGQFLRSPSLREVLAMSGRVRQMRTRSYLSQARVSVGGGPIAHTLATSPYWDSRWEILAQGSAANSMGPSAQNVIMRMKPQRREELIQGMQEQAPRGYQPYVQEYFKQLAKIGSTASQN
jgi:hypothetical protein